MFGKLFQLNYPVWESEEESWNRFEEIYKLSAELAGNCQAVPQRGSSLDECWKDVALLWDSNPMACGNVDPFFEALYHICFRRFSDRAHNPLLMRLLLLIEDELLTFSFAFKAWLQVDSFEEAYHEITNPYWDNKTFKKRFDTEIYLYLMYRVVKLVMLKNLKHDEWLRLFPMGDNLYPFRSYEVYRNVDAYEEAVKFLIPAANSWYEEWADRAVMVEAISQIYGVDFSDDIKGLYSLIYAVEHRKNIDTCSWHLYRTKACSMTLLQKLWGADYAEKLQLGFLSLCKRYKNAKRRKPVRGRYGYSDFMNHWIYQQINTWRSDNTVGLNPKVRNKLFDIALDL